MSGPVLQELCLCLLSAHAFKPTPATALLLCQQQKSKLPARTARCCCQHPPAGAHWAVKARLTVHRGLLEGQAEAAAQGFGRHSPAAHSWPARQGLAAEQALLGGDGDGGGGEIGGGGDLAGGGGQRTKPVQSLAPVGSATQPQQPSALGAHL